MGNVKDSRRGFTLIAALLLLLLLSGMSIGLLYMVSGSNHISGNDMETNNAYYAAQSGMEQLTTNLASLYQANLRPDQTDLDGMATSSSGSAASLFPGTSFIETVKWASPAVDASGALTGYPNSKNNVVSQGPDVGLTAVLIPVTMQVTAIRPSGAAVSMTRGVEAALIPVFQFGVFSQSDLSYFAGPEFNFQGRVHTNGNLFLAANSGPLIFGSKVTAVGQIIRDQLANGHMGTDYKGSVYVPNQTGGCDSFIAAGGTGSVPTNCIDVGSDSNKSENDASWSGGYPTGGRANTNWTAISTGTFNSMLGNQTSTGVQPLNLPFVQSNTAGQAADPIEIIRKPELSTEDPTSPLGASREMNKANIRILFGDHQSDLHPTGSANDADDIQLDNGSVVLNSGATAYFAVANNNSSVNQVGSCTRRSPCTITTTIADPYWNSFLPAGPRCGGSLPGATCTASTTPQWPIVRGWLRVEYLGKDGSWHGVTREWLKYGFAMDPYIARTTPGADTIGHKDAILLLQQIADRDGDGAITNKTISVTTTPASNTTAVLQYTESTASTGLGTNTNFYPINLYDAREGFPRDVIPTGWSGTTNCYTNGIMSVAELDIGNLTNWIAATGDYAGSSGQSVDATPQGGYLVYFSDRRGMEPNPNAKDESGNLISPAATNGESGLEDVINSTSATGMPDGTLESSEDVDNNTRLDNWGSVNIADGIGVSAGGNQYQSTDCMNGGRQNWVSGARRALKLVDGSIGNLPMPGFTVASENPVYVQGDYNSNAGDTVWNSTPVDETHSNSSVIADAVTLLSNGWSDLNSMGNPSNLNGRTPIDTYYRTAIAAGKNINFPVGPVAYGATGKPDFGTDGGLHNFLRLLENGGTLHYRGSLVSLFYAEYATGTFKCCTLVYGAPTRKFSFDTDFLDPSNLPPGTPELQDIVNLSYWQSFTPCTTQASGNCTN